jgi:hypothetical protein
MAIPAHMTATINSKKGMTPKFGDFFYEDASIKRERQNKEFVHFLDRFKPKSAH